MESAEIIPALDFDELAAGETKQAAFTVRNIGAARTFQFTVTDALHFVTGIEPTELNLGADQSGKLLVKLAVPNGIAAGTGNDLVVVATSKAGPATSNSSVVHLSVASAKDANN